MIRRLPWTPSSLPLTLLLSVLVSCGTSNPPSPTADTTLSGDSSPSTPTDIGAALTGDGDIGDSDTATPRPDADAPDTAATDTISSKPCPGDTNPLAGLIATQSGLLQGVPEGAGFVFRGIPYAAPPVGDRRFRPPAPATCAAAPVTADAFAPSCPQLDKSGALIGAEDCLGLNVWTAGPLTPDVPRPVMVFIHGGGHIQGSGAETVIGGKLLYDGRRLADAGDLIVVTFNFRLGPLGFLTLPGLEQAPVPSLNLGIQDQVAALTWVHNNIAAFGGDPARVTLFGESGGAVDTCIHVASPKSQGLFQAALMESGGCVVTPRGPVLVGHGALVDQSACGTAEDRLACLRELSLPALFEALPPDMGALFTASLGNNDPQFQPVVDTDFIPESPLDAIAGGHHHAVPLVVGNNSEELAGNPSFKVQTEAAYQTRIQATFGPLDPALPAKILAAYPVSDYQTPEAALVAVFSDMRFVCPNRWVARAAAKGQSEPVYRFLFSRQPATNKGSLPASHGIELTYVFGSLHNIAFFTPAAPDAALSDTMMRYWTRFAATGTPNTAADPAWPPYNGAAAPGQEPYLTLDVPISAHEHLRAAQCDLWDQIADQLGVLPAGAQ